MIRRKSWSCTVSPYCESHRCKSSNGGHKKLQNSIFGEIESLGVEAPLSKNSFQLCDNGVLIKKLTDECKSHKFANS